MSDEGLDQIGARLAKLEQRQQEPEVDGQEHCQLCGRCHGKGWVYERDHLGGWGRLVCPGCDGEASDA